MADDSVTVWFPSDPEDDRVRLWKTMDTHLGVMEYAVDRAQEHLGKQGYKIRTDDLTQLRDLIGKFENDCVAPVTRMSIEPLSSAEARIVQPLLRDGPNASSMSVHANGSNVAH